MLGYNGNSAIRGPYSQVGHSLGAGEVETDNTQNKKQKR